MRPSLSVRFLPDEPSVCFILLLIPRKQQELTGCQSILPKHRPSSFTGSYKGEVGPQFCCFSDLEHGSDSLCTNGGCGPDGDDSRRPDGFQLTLAFIFRRHTSSSRRSTFYQVRYVYYYYVWRFCSNKVLTG
ncbi:hypothetical protein DPMN_133367 [Dreissena polymorpha]|uniref:Uncharacterized protein n=1 Tax=Dreissena polymorpha TaxID=45954 RepID=A0A9D4JAX0_DREPO|nr:hypothetical protein DPMN_133367 [Dreissena polymorpha]